MSALGCEFRLPIENQVPVAQEYSSSFFKAEAAFIPETPRGIGHGDNVPGDNWVFPFVD